MSGRPIRCLPFGVALVALALSASAESPGPTRDDPNAAMRVAFGALTQLFPLSLSDASFSDPAKRKTIDAQFEELVRAARRIATHGETRDLGFGDLSQQLLKDASRAARFMREGRSDEARAFVYLMTQNCLDCHSRFPSDRDFELAPLLMRQVDVETLDDVARARLHVVTRGFEDALATWERAFRNPAISPTELDLTNQPFEYLRIALRVRNEPDRARRALAKLAAREDAPIYLRRRLNIWVGALERLESAPPGTGVSAARQLALEASQLTAFPDSREGAVQDFAASSLLLKLIDDTPKDPAQRGRLSEAYYLLAQLEDRLTRSYWSGLTESYLEAAVRAGGGRGFAWEAYARLEELLTREFSGTLDAEALSSREERLRVLRGFLPAPPEPGEARGQPPSRQTVR